MRLENIKLNKKTFIQVSALGVNKCKNSLYSKSKFDADKYIQKNLKKIFIQFFNTGMAKILKL